MVLSDGQGDNGMWEGIKTDIQEQLDQSRRELREIEMMLEQSQVEVDKLAQRNTSITSHLQQIQANFDNMPRSDIRTAYDAALDAQQRLVTMRGQLEKLQSDRTHLDRYKKILEQVQNAIEGGPPETTSSTGTFASAEMMIQAQEAERQRLSRQMHDGPAQALSNFILQTEIAMRLFEVDQEKARDELGNLKMAATNTFQRVRDFIFDLRPMMLDDLGLAPTVRRYTDAFKEKSGIDVSVTVSGAERRLESYLEVLVFRAIQDLLNNVAQHSQATQVKVQIDMGESEIRASVDDNGKGFDTQELGQQSGLGLKLIKERVEMLGGQFEIDSAIGQGTRIGVRVPVGGGATVFA